MTPLFVNLRDRLCVIVGGGAVGKRKAATVVAGGARVRLVCLEARPDDDHTPTLEWVNAPYQPSHLDEAALVFAASPPDVNRRVIADAHARGLWVNSASEPESGDFFMPATVHRGGLIIAVGTSGAAPALAREVRDLLDAQLDDAFGQWVALLAELRPAIQAAVPDPEWRRQLFQRLARPEWLDRLRHETAQQVRDAMRGEMQALADALPAPL